MAILYKNAQKACGVSNCVINSPINFISHSGRTLLFLAQIGFPAAILKKSCVLIWNGEKCDRKWFSVIQNGRQQPFCEQNKSKLRIYLKWWEMQWPACKPFRDIQSVSLLFIFIIIFYFFYFLSTVASHYGLPYCNSHMGTICNWHNKSLIPCLIVSNITLISEGIS